MITNFSIYGENSAATANSIPAAAKESLVTISFHNQNEVLKSIEAGLGTIQGYMTNEFNYSSNGNYKNVWDTSFPENIFTRLVSDETQRNLFNYGYATKKMFSHGESPIITVEFTCYSGDDETGPSAGVIGLTKNPVAIGMMLTNATLPKVADTNDFLSTGLTDQFVNGAVAAWDNVVNLGSAVVGDKGSVKEAFNKLANDFSSTKPPVCKLTIGNIFEKDMMVVKRVESKFSKEFLLPGVPLYGNFSVTFESLYNAANLVGNDAEKELIFGTGFKLKDTSGKSRVSFNDQPTQSASQQKQIPPTNVGDPGKVYERVK